MLLGTNLYTKVWGTPGRHFREHSFAGKVGFVRDVLLTGSGLGRRRASVAAVACDLADNLLCIRGRKARVSSLAIVF